MPAPKLTLLITGLLFSAWLFPAEAAESETTSGTPTNQPAFKVTAKNEYVPNLPPATRVYVSAPPMKFALLTPWGYRLDTQTAKEVQFATEDYDCFIDFRIADPDHTDTATPDSAYCGNLALSRFPGATIRDRFPQSAGNGINGQAFDMDWKGSGEVAQTVRVVYIPSKVGILEFSLTCPQPKFKTAQYQLNSVLLTFRAADQNEKLDIAPLSNKF